MRSREPGARRDPWRFPLSEGDELDAAFLASRLPAFTENKIPVTLCISV